MRFGVSLCLLYLLLRASAVGAAPRAQPDSLDAETVIALARSRAPRVLEAEARLAEAAAGRVLAGIRANPEIEITTGERDGGQRHTSAELSVPVGLGVARGRGLRAAGLAEDAAGLDLAEVRASAAAEGLAAYYRVLHAQRRVELAERRVALAGQLLETTRDRIASGDAARIEAHMGDVEASRARSGLLVERQAREDARLALTLVLGLEPDDSPRVVGDLADRTRFAEIALDAEPRTLRGVRAATARLDEARATLSRAELGWVPDLAFRLDYESEAGYELWMPGAAISLPLFARGQGDRALARARVEAGQRELDRLGSAARAQWMAARAAWVSALEAVNELEANAVPRSRELETMAELGYRAGKSNLGALLLLRRDALDTLNEYHDRLLEAALRGIDLALASGAWPHAGEQGSSR